VVKLFHKVLGEKIMVAPRPNTKTLLIKTDKNNPDCIISKGEHEGQSDISQISITCNGGKGLCYICEDAFKDMQKLNSVVIMAEVVVICKNAFAENSQLSTLTIKTTKGVFIDDRAIANAGNLSSAALYGRFIVLSPDVFYNRPKKSNIKATCYSCISGDKCCFSPCSGIGAMPLEFDKNGLLFPNIAPIEEKTSFFGHDLRDAQAQREEINEYMKTNHPEVFPQPKKGVLMKFFCKLGG